MGLKTLACYRRLDSGGERRKDARGVGAPSPIATPIVHSPLFTFRASFCVAPPLSERLEQAIKYKMFKGKYRYQAKLEFREA